MTEPVRIDFFISYNHADQQWAAWVAWVLEEAGYTTRIQAWDFRPGSNFVLEMDEAARLGERTIAILSPNYLGSDFVAPEWAAAFAGDPRGRTRTVIPVRIAASRADGLLGQLVWIDLVELLREDAKAALLAGLQPGRRKPVTEPAYPGLAGESRAERPGEDSATPDPDRAEAPAWRPLTSPPNVSWRTDMIGQASQTSHTVLEVHLLPVPALHLEVRRIAELGSELAELGRRAGMFGPEQAVDIQANGSRAYARSTAGRTNDEAGLAVARNGQRGAWISLPHDQMCAVYDPYDLKPRVVSLLGTLEAIAISTPSQVAFGLRIEPLMMLSIGKASKIGHRTSSSMPFTTRHDATVAPDDCVENRWVTSTPATIAEELIARLSAVLG